MSRRAAIVQSNYIPWKGYFDLINNVDTFILFDHVQYTRRDWRNRNRIKTPKGPIWLSIPVNVKGKYHQKIMEVTVSDTGWNRKHWRSIELNYSKAPYFSEYKNLFQELYLGTDERNLSLINERFIHRICRILGITTKITRSTDYRFRPGRNETLINLCHEAKADTYLSGPSAKSYLDEDLLHQAGIAVKYMDYSDYPVYSQLYPPFDHHVSIIDLIFNTGPNATKYMKSF